jgi:hypothetical protein
MKNAEKLVLGSSTALSSIRWRPVTRGDLLYFPLMAVRWLTPPREIAAFVSDAGPDRFRARLFHFGTKPRQMSAELYMLKPGTYQMKLLHAKPSGVAHIDRREIEVRRPGSRIRFQLPAQILCELTLLRRL